MSAPIRRRRKAGDELDMPDDLLAWFRGEPRDKVGPPWSALWFPDCELLHERWQAFAEVNPGARPPAGYERLAEPEPPLQGHQRSVRAIARAAVARRRGQ